MRSVASFACITAYARIMGTEPNEDTECMDWHRDLGFLLFDVAQLYTKRFEERARELFLRPIQCKVLALLATCEGASQAHLAQISEVDPVRLLRILDCLETAGLAERRSDGHDRKTQRLGITERAKPVVERVWEIGRNTSTEGLKGVTSDELHLLMDLLERVHANLLALAAEPVPAWRQGLRRKN
jgi:MarR family transcriptional regulator, transcriptional regulator for hemolysin